MSTITSAQTPVSFSTHTQPLTTQSFTDVTNTLAVDLNNDGVPDMVIAETPNFTTVLSVGLAHGDGTFEPQYEVPISSSAVPEGPLFFGDFNNDGKADLGMLVTNVQTASTTSKIAILLGDGDGTFQPTKFVPVDVTNAGSLGEVFLCGKATRTAAGSTGPSGSALTRSMARRSAQFLRSAYLA